MFSLLRKMSRHYVGDWKSTMKILQKMTRTLAYHCLLFLRRRMPSTDSAKCP